MPDGSMLAMDVVLPGSCVASSELSLPVHLSFDKSNRVRGLEATRRGVLGAGFGTWGEGACAKAIRGGVYESLRCDRYWLRSAVNECADSEDWPKQSVEYIDFTGRPADIASPPAIQRCEISLHFDQSTALELKFT